MTDVFSIFYEINVNNEITEEELQKAVDNCFWKIDMDGVDVCKGALAPCLRIIEKGECDTIKDLVLERIKNDSNISNG